MSLNRMILCSKLKKGLCKTVIKSQVVTKFNVTKSRLHCTQITNGVIHKTTACAVKFVLDLVLLILFSQCSRTLSLSMDNRHVMRASFQKIPNIGRFQQMGWINCRVFGVFPVELSSIVWSLSVPSPCHSSMSIGNF